MKIKSLVGTIGLLVCLFCVAVSDADAQKKMGVAGTEIFEASGISEDTETPLITEKTEVTEYIKETETSEIAEVVEPETEQIECPAYIVADVSDSVNVRSGPGTDHELVGKMYDGAMAEVVSMTGGEEIWFQIHSGNVDGFVKADFFLWFFEGEFDLNSENLIFAKTIEEDRAERLARQEAEKQARLEKYANVEFPDTTYETNAELRQSIVDYALQYVGNQYVHGGTSLATGTDCSGFTCFIYAEFGYSISRTPGGQYSDAGRSIEFSEIQPGDIICYSSNGGESCTHVAFYIGNGQIVHAANSRKGVITSQADYSPIIGIKNVID